MSVVLPILLILGYAHSLDSLESFGVAAESTTETKCKEPALPVPKEGLLISKSDANMPQIHYGMLTRDVAVTIDWCWNGWNEQQRKRSLEIICQRTLLAIRQLSVANQFDSYGPTFHDLLEPGVEVPFGTGWQDVDVDYAEEVSYVRIVILSYWALGGGLNEIQVYKSE